MTTPSSRGSAVVVAHPDDEALWLSSVLAAAKRLVFCFGDPLGKPDKARARRSAVAALNDARLVDLAIPESGAGFAVDWAKARASDFGIEIADLPGRLRYEANYERLRQALEGCLAGFDEVYTHNPWGEYGHAEHIQVFRAVRELQGRLGFRLGFSHYVGPANWSFALQQSRTLGWDERRLVKPDLGVAHQLRRIYRAHGAWTWSRWHRWPAQEAIYVLDPGAESPVTRASFRGERLQDVTALRPWRWPGKPSLRQLS